MTTLPNPQIRCATCDAGIGSHGQGPAYGRPKGMEGYDCVKHTDASWRGAVNKR